MAVGLRALNKIGLLDIVDRWGCAIRPSGFCTRPRRPRCARPRLPGARLPPPRSSRGPRGSRRLAGSDLFDLTPTDEQQMLRDSVREFALASCGPWPRQPTTLARCRPSCCRRPTSSGCRWSACPSSSGGAVEERSAVTSVLMSEALAQGDMGMAVACLAPAGVSTALSLWGDADQQATYLPEFVGEDVPAAALALLEPRALFDPFSLQTRARAREGGYVLDGAKSLVPRAAEGELFIVGAELEGRGPALFGRRSQGGRDRRPGAAGDGRSRRRNRRADIRRRRAARGGSAGRRRPSRVRRVCRAGAPGLVRAGRRAPRRRCSTT